MGMHEQSLSRVQLFVIPWTVGHQAPLSLEFSGQEYWSGLPFPLPGDLPNPGIKPASPALAGRLFTTEPPGKPLISIRANGLCIGTDSCTLLGSRSDINFTR